MVKKNGFISISIIYSFFIVMMLLLVLIMSTYINNRFSFTIYKNDIKKGFVVGIDNPYEDADLLNQYIKPSLSPLSGTWEIISDSYGIRYSGGSPNNYIRFNGELWRIIGVFYSSTHGCSGEDLVKIIRDEPIKVGSEDNFEYGWDNEWNGSTIDITLRDYFDSINGYSQNLVREVYWKTGTFTSLTSSIESINLRNERSDTGTSGNIGLMYPTDYAYASLEDGCPRDVADFSLNNYSKCKAYNYLAKSIDEWTISPSSGSFSVNYIKEDGSVAATSSTNDHKIRPVVYLKSTVKLSSGSGTYDDPYTVGI